MTVRVVSRAHNMDAGGPVRFAMLTDPRLLSPPRYHLAPLSTVDPQEDPTGVFIPSPHESVRIRIHHQNGVQSQSLSVHGQVSGGGTFSVQKGKVVIHSYHYNEIPIEIQPDRGYWRHGVSSTSSPP